MMDIYTECLMVQVGVPCESLLLSILRALDLECSANEGVSQEQGHTYNFLRRRELNYRMRANIMAASK